MSLDANYRYQPTPVPMHTATLRGTDAGRRNITQCNPADMQHAEDVRAKYMEFVGKTFYSQMLKAMRSTQQKPAYFHGGRSEEVFQGQLDQTLVDNWSEASAHRFAKPMFEHQFPHLAKTLREHSQLSSAAPLAELDNLRRP